MPKSKPSPPAFAPDEHQRQAIEHLHGPMLVIAGAGTGKTTVLTQRIARLIRENHARPDEILAVTYTENASREMRERLQLELGRTATADLQTTTFHAYCNNLLIRSGKQFGVLDEVDLWIYLRRRIRELKLNYFVRAANVSKFLEDLLEFMRRCQDELVGPERYAEYVGRLECGDLPIPRVGRSKEAGALSDEEVLGRCREIARIFATVERMLGEENLGTFGHMITKAYELLDSDADLLLRERRRTRFILVDEFQDANFAQVKILQRLAGEERNVFAVGDPDQAIFRFRGASSAAFGLFLRQFPGAGLVALEKNRRSTTPILKCAFALITKNPETFAGMGSDLAYRRTPLVSARAEQAVREGRELPSVSVEAVLLPYKDAESTDLVAVIRKKQRELHCSWSDFAVLYRQHNHRDRVAEELAEEGIPFSIENMDVMDTPAARDLFACAGAVVSTSDGASLFRVAALPQFNINPEKLRIALRAVPKESKESAVAVALEGIEGGAAVLQAVAQARDDIARRGAKGRAALEILVQQFDLDRSARPLMAVLEFAARWEEKPITKTTDLRDLLEYLAYFREARGVIPMPSENENAVRLMSAHGAKGLEFKHVFVIRANSSSFPCGYREPLFEFPRELRDNDSVAQGEGKMLHDQEERRLFYVAMTRAQDSLTFYARQGKGKDTTPAGLLRELLKDATLGRWLQSRPAQAFQTDMFAMGMPTIFLSRTSEWLSAPPTTNLHLRLSASAVDTYNRCPLQFKLEREWRLPRELPAALHYGGVMHAVLRAYYDSVRAQRTMTDAELIEFFRSTLRAAAIPEQYQHDLYERQGTEQLQEFLAESRRSPVPQVLHTEEPFEIRIGDAVVAGRIDRIDQLANGKVVVTDYKTGKPKSQEDADESLQLSIYALAAREKWGYGVDHLVFHNLEGNTAVITGRGEPDLQAAKVKVEEAAASISSGDFNATPGFHCGFCPYRNLCPATEKRVYGAPATRELRIIRQS